MAGMSLLGCCCQGDPGDVVDLVNHPVAVGDSWPGNSLALSPLRVGPASVIKFSDDGEIRLTFVKVIDGEPTLVTSRVGSAPITPYHADFTPPSWFKLYDTMVTLINQWGVDRTLGNIGEDLRPRKEAYYIGSYQTYDDTCYHYIAVLRDFDINRTAEYYTFMVGTNGDDVGPARRFRPGIDNAVHAITLDNDLVVGYNPDHTDVRPYETLNSVANRKGIAAGPVVGSAYGSGRLYYGASNNFYNLPFNTTMAVFPGVPGKYWEQQYYGRSGRTWTAYGTLGFKDLTKETRARTSVVDEGSTRAIDSLGLQTYNVREDPNDNTSTTIAQRYFLPSLGVWPTSWASTGDLIGDNDKDPSNNLGWPSREARHNYTLCTKYSNFSDVTETTWLVDPWGSDDSEWRVLKATFHIGIGIPSTEDGTVTDVVQILENDIVLKWHKKQIPDSGVGLGSGGRFQPGNTASGQAAPPLGSEVIPPESTITIVNNSGGGCTYTPDWGIITGFTGTIQSSTLLFAGSDPVAEPLTLDRYYTYLSTTADVDTTPRLDGVPTPGLSEDGWDLGISPLNQATQSSYYFETAKENFFLVYQKWETEDYTWDVEFTDTRDYSAGDSYTIDCGGSLPLLEGTYTVDDGRVRREVTKVHSYPNYLSPTTHFNVNGQEGDVYWPGTRSDRDNPPRGWIVNPNHTRPSRAASNSSFPWGMFDAGTLLKKYDAETRTYGSGTEFPDTVPIYYEGVTQTACFEGAGENDVVIAQSWSGQGTYRFPPSPTTPIALGTDFLFYNGTSLNKVWRLPGIIVSNMVDMVCSDEWFYVSWQIPGTGGLGTVEVGYRINRAGTAWNLARREGMLNYEGTNFFRETEPVRASSFDNNTKFAEDDAATDQSSAWTGEITLSASMGIEFEEYLDSLT